MEALAIFLGLCIVAFALLVNKTSPDKSVPPYRELQQLADAVSLIADLLDRELPTGYRHIEKMRERNGQKQP
jgi:hypothetical protein